MGEVVIAVYNTARAAETAVADLQIAKVPTTRIVSDPVVRASLVESCRLGRQPESNVVAATVDERHASLVLSILGMQAPATLTEATLKAA